MADPYGPNRKLTGHIRAPISAGSFVVTALAIYLSWFLARQSLFVILPEDAALGATRVGFLLNMAFFGLLIMFTARAALRVHGVPLRAFLGDPSRLISDFVSVLGAAAAAYAVLIFLGWDASVATMRPFTGWLAFLPLALIGIFIQSGAEEIFYRGYLHHFCTYFLEKPILWILFPSLAFGLSHIFNDLSSPSTAAAYILWTTAFGVACVDLTARSGSIGAAWGLHMAVNTAALCLAAEDGAPISAAALFIFPERTAEYVPDSGLIWIALAFELFFLFVLWLVARNAIRR